MSTFYIYSSDYTTVWEIHHVQSICSISLFAGTYTTCILYGPQTHHPVQLIEMQTNQSLYGSPLSVLQLRTSSRINVRYVMAATGHEDQGSQGYFAF